MKKWMIFPVLFILLCCNHKQKISPYVLSQLEMRKIFTDAFKADEMAGYYMVNDSSYSGLKKHAEMYNTIFKIHHVSKEQFKRSLEYYETHPALLKAVLDSIQVSTDSTIKHAPPAKVKTIP